MRPYILTIKLEKNPHHDPRAKITGNCEISQFCTDKTGAHHSVLICADSEQAVRRYADARGWHVTRIERANDTLVAIQ